jgi:hypothetical protein
MHGAAILKHAFIEVQTFLKLAYWDEIHFKLDKRENLLSQFQYQLERYEVCGNKHAPLFFEISDLTERKKILQKYTKSNVKVPKLLDPYQLAHLVSTFIERTLSLIEITFQDFSAIQHIVFKHETAREGEIKNLARSQFSKKSEFWCFLFSLEKKYTPERVSLLLHTSVLSQFLQEAKQLLSLFELPIAG